MHAPSPTHAPAFRAASYNIHACVGRDRQCNPQRILHVLHELAADVLALQEVGGRQTIDEKEQFDFLKLHLGMNGVSGAHLRRGKFSFGNAVFARGEIEDARLIDLSVTGFETRGAIDCLVRLEHGRARVLATHLGLLPNVRRKQIAILRHRLAERRSEADVTVVLGDFNIFGLERRSLRRIGAPARLPRLRTFPARRPLMSLDRIWTIPNERQASLHVHGSALSRIASDHLPVVAEISLAAAAQAAA